MKKITLLLVFFFAVFSASYGQCIRTSLYGSIVCNNSGLPQTIVTCAYTSNEFSVVSGLSVGGNYLFTGQTGTTAGQGTDNYLTITDDNDNVLMMGYSPLTFESITNDTVRIHHAIDETCTGANACNNATVTAILTCPIPLNVTVDGISTTTANFTWDAGGSETEWEILILPNGDPVPDASTSGTVVSGTSTYLATGLTESSAYQFYVRASCGGGDYSPWVLGSSFVTSCTPLTSLPFFEDFETTATGINIFPPCWAHTNSSGVWSIATFPTAYSGSNSLRRSWSTDGWAYTPLAALNAGTSYNFSYYVRTNDEIVGYDVTVAVGASQTEADMTETLDAVTGYHNANWVKKSFNFTPATTGNYSFGLHVVGPNPPNGINFDDFKIDLTPSCVEPTDLVVSDITNSTATVSWTESITTPADGYQYYISVDPTAPDAGTVATGTVGAGVLTYNFTGLTDNTTYYVWVRSACSGGTSEWSLSRTFNTLCLPTSLPWFEDFETTAVGSNVFPSCWAYTNTLSNWSIATNPVAYSGVNSLRRSWSTDGWAYTPPATLNAGTSYTLSYFVRTNDEVVGYDVTVAVGTGQTEADMTETLDAVTGYHNANWEKKVFNFTPASAGNYSFGFHVVAPFAPNGINFDDFKINLTPSCVEPTALVASDVTDATATVSWTESITIPANGYQYYISEDATNPDSVTAPTGTVAAGVLTYNFTALTANTTYNVWVRSACTGETSEWSSKVIFKTLCIAATDLFENFDASTNIPDCWSKVGAGGNISVSSFNTAFSAPNNMSLSSNNTTDLATVALPSLSNSASGTHQLKFKARSQYTWALGGMIEVGYLTDINDPTSFVMLESFTTTSGTVYDSFTANLGTQPLSMVLAMRNPGTPTNGVVIDDVSWSPIPTTAPDCAVSTATPDAACGNFATVLSWEPVAGVDGYNLSIGTSAGLNDIMNNEPIGDVVTYNYVGNYNTTYYFTVRPFNAFGSATGCAEQSFSTFAEGCYCTSVPTTNDGSGITNVQLGTVDFPNGDVQYADYTSTPVDLGQGLSTNLQVSFATGYTYDTHVWIDFNNDFTFDDSEIVISGISPQPNPSNLDLTFTMPSDAALGTHRMRLGSSDFGQVTPNPCYSGSWGVTIDFSVNIIISTCTPPSVVSSTIVDDCANNQYFVAVEVSSLGNGTPSITDGTTSYPITSVGTIQVGPFVNGTITNLNLIHGTETICDLPLGNFTFTCPASNDNLCAAILLTVGDDSTGFAFSNIGSTAETGEAVPSCFNSGINGSVWFSFVAPASGQVSVSTDISGGTLTDTEIAVYDATSVTCADLSTLGAPVGCDQDSGTVVNYNSVLNLTTLTGGTTYYVQVDRWGSNQNGSFGLKITDLLLTTNAFDNKNFTYYPNPVKDVLNLSYTKNISSVTVFNLLGQQITTKVVNANQSKIDMSNLASGTYLVKVTADNQVKTIKVIKE